MEIMLDKRGYGGEIKLQNGAVIRVKRWSLYTYPYTVSVFTDSNSFEDCNIEGKAFYVRADVESNSCDLRDEGEIRLDFTSCISLIGSGTIHYIINETVNDAIINAYIQFNLDGELNEVMREELDID